MRGFSGEVTEKPVLHVDPIIWKSDEFVWVNQWPLTKQKLQFVQQLVQGQVDNGYIMSFISPWNFPLL